MVEIGSKLKLSALLAATVLLTSCAMWEDFLAADRAAAVPEHEPLAQRVPQEPLDANTFVLDDPEQQVIGQVQVVFASETDTLSELAREYGLGYDEIVDANPGVDPWIPGAGTAVILPTQFVLPRAAKRGIVLNIAAKRLFYFPEPADGEARVVMTYPIGIGRVGWETPLGAAEVISKARDPHWWVPASVRKEHAELGDPLPAVVPPGPDNPLGRYVLKLDMPGYLIHGTNQPYGVGMRVSHGCVRLYPENIETLYPLIALGAAVEIVNQPYLAGYLDGELYFEGHTPLEDDDVSSVDQLVEALSGLDVDSVVDRRALIAQMESVATEGLGMPVRVQRNDVAEVLERARLVKNTVEPDPDVPTLAEVRALLDEPLEPETTEPDEGRSDE